MQNHSEYQRKMAADVHKDLYPCTPSDWFSRHKISRLNYKSVSNIIRCYYDGSRYLKVLDVGCGNGLWSLGLFGGGGVITGIEIDERLLSYARVNSELSKKCEFEGVLLRDWTNRPSSYDFALSIGVVECLDSEELCAHLSLLSENLREGGHALLIFSTWRPLSVCYLPWIHRGGYSAACRVTGFNISKLKLNEIKAECRLFQFDVIDGGGINPFPSKLWSLAHPWGYVTRNQKLSNYYYQQFLVLRRT